MWRTFIREYLRFSRKEQLGIGMLVLAMLLTSYFPDLFFYFQRRPVAGSDDLKAAVQAFESQPAMSRASHENAATSPAGALFYFDPNTLPPAGWQQLGVSERTAGTIGKYLAKGGHFRVATDLEKVYGLPPALCAQLIPYVRIRDSRSFSGRYAPHHRHDEENGSGGFGKDRGRFGKEDRGYGGYGGFGRFGRDSGFTRRRGMAGNGNFRYDSGFTRYRSFAGTPDSSFVRYRKKQPSAAIDINEADSMVWQSLPGIGPGFARRIITFRERLGGFYAVEQVAECYGLPDSVFQKIQPFLQIGSSSLKKLDLNGSDEKSLAAHPYIRYKLARLIVQYRSSHAGFREVSDLRSLPLVDEIIYRKIEHYIEIKH